MTNPQLGFDELAAAQSQPEVVLNAADRAVTAALIGEITIDFASDANHTLQASDPLDPADEWPYGTIVMTDDLTVLTGPVSVLYPDLDALYGGPSRPRFFFSNQTAEVLTVLVSGETGVPVAPGATRLLRYDGSDVVLGESGDPPTSQVVTLAGTAFNLDDLTNGGWHEFTSATPVTITIENDATTPVPAAAEYGLMVAGAGGVTLVEDDLASVVPPKSGTLVLAQNDFAVLKRRAVDSYKLLGETVAA